MFNNVTLIFKAATLMPYKAILISYDATLMFANETLLSVAKVLIDEDKLMTLIDGELIAEGNWLMLRFALPSSAIKALLTRKGSPMRDDNL